MKNKDKAELLKDTIYQLYSKEGRSISYIGKLLGIDRKIVSKKIREWDLPEPETKRHLKPSTQKFINKNRTFIKSRLDRNQSVSSIAEELHCSRDLIQKVAVVYDPILKKAHDDYIRRLHETHEEYVNNLISQSPLQYDYETYTDEKWKRIPGYSNYEVSNYGRIRGFAKRYKRTFLLRQEPNKNNGRLYVRLTNDYGISKNLQVSRLVGFSFVSGYSETHNTINHEDGDVSNNKWTNLSWSTQGENNKHSYDVLHRRKVDHKRYKFRIIRYKNKYEFRTITAFSKFLHKSETQTRRYLDDPSKYDIKLIE